MNITEANATIAVLTQVNRDDIAQALTFSPVDGLACKCTLCVAVRYLAIRAADVLQLGTGRDLLERLRDEVLS